MSHSLENVCYTVEYLAVASFHFSCLGFLSVILFLSLIFFFRMHKMPLKNVDYLIYIDVTGLTSGCVIYFPYNGTDSHDEMICAYEIRSSFVMCALCSVRA